MLTGLASHLTLFLHGACRLCSKLQACLWLQATQQDLQRTEGALETAHVELEDLKAHMREQEVAIQELQEALNSKETLLNTISMAACKAQATSICCANSYIMFNFFAQQMVYPCKAVVQMWVLRLVNESCLI